MMAKKIVLLAAALFLMTGLFGTAHAEEFATASIPAEYQVTNDAEVDTTFTLKGVNGAPVPGGGETKTVRMTKGGEIDLGTLTFTGPELYEYKLTKDTRDQPGLTRDDSSYTIYVAVTTDGGVSVICKKDNTEEKPEKIVFADAVMNNTPKCSDEPFVIKTVQGKGDASDSFTFELSSSTGSEPMPEAAKNGTQQIQAVPGEAKRFGTITFREAGEYEYRIREIDDGKEGYTYDTTVYDVRYTVVEKEGELVCTRKVEIDGKEVNAAAFGFLNVYKEKGDVVPPEGRSDVQSEDTTSSKNNETKEHSSIYEKTFGKVAKTGDAFNIFVYVVMSLISLCIILLFVTVRRIEKKRN